MSCRAAIHKNELATDWFYFITSCQYWENDEETVTCKALELCLGARVIRVLVSSVLEYFVRGLSHDACWCWFAWFVILISNKFISNSMARIPTVTRFVKCTFVSANDVTFKFIHLRSLRHKTLLQLSSLSGCWWRSLFFVTYISSDWYFKLKSSDFKIRNDYWFFRLHPRNHVQVNKIIFSKIAVV